MSDEIYDGWVIKNNYGSLLARTFALLKKDIKRGFPRWREWEKDGHKIVKVKLVEVK